MPNSIAGLIKRVRDDGAHTIAIHLGSFEHGIDSIDTPSRNVSGQTVDATNVAAALTNAKGNAHHLAIRDASLSEAEDNSSRLGSASAAAPDGAAAASLTTR